MSTMPLYPAIRNVFVQLSGSLELMSQDEFVRPCLHLSNATIGQHFRHIIEMFQCLEQGYHTGTVNYEGRKRDRAIESSRDTAKAALKSVFDQLDKDDKVIFLEGAYSDQSSELLRIATNYHREILYNLEHAIHHLALIRIGIKELKNVDLPEGYGVAPATVKFQKSCAQ